METPKATIIISARNAAGALGECLVSIMDQNEPSWRAVVVDRASSDETEQIAAAIAQDEPRLSLLQAGEAAPAGAWNAGLGRATGRFVLFMEAEDRLLPDALASLIESCEAGGGAAVGGFEHTGPWGEALAGPCAVAPDDDGSIGAEAFRHALPFPIHAQMIARPLLGERPFDESLQHAADRALWLRLAAEGVRWRIAPGTAARRTLRPALSGRAAADLLCEHLAVAARADGAEGSPAAHELRLAIATLELAADPDAPFERLLDIASSVRSAAGAAPRLNSGDEPPVLTSPVSAAARWWARLGCIGPAPAPMATVARSSVAGVIGSVERIPAMILSSLDPGRPIELLGLGKNARRLARAMAARGLPVRGRDDALSAPPGWAREDRIEVRLVPPSAPFDPRTQYVMTVLNDGPFLARVPEGIAVVRWASAAEQASNERQRWLHEWCAA